MEGLKRALPWGRREKVAPAPQPAAPLPRQPVVPHHWLTVAVVRPGPVAPLPVVGARVVVRPYPRGAARPEDPVARATTGPDGTVALFLPAGRYAVIAQHEGEGRAVTVTLEHAGRATLPLESLGRRVVLTVEVCGEDGNPLPDAAVDVRTVPTGTPAAHATTDDDGVAALTLPPGAYEVRVGDAVVKTFIEADTVLRLTAVPAAHEAPPQPPVSRYAQKARAATSVVALLDSQGLREETWN